MITAGTVSRDDRSGGRGSAQWNHLMESHPMVRTVNSSARDEVPRPDEPDTDVAPYAMFRVAALPCPAPPACSEPFRIALADLVTRTAALQSRTPAVTAALHRAVPNHRKVFQQKVLLPVRRDIHNNRLPRPALIHALGHAVDDVPGLADWLAARAEIGELAERVERSLPDALAAERVTLAAMCAEDPLRKAAALSGRDLLHGIDRTAGRRGEPDKRTRKAEPAVLRYALRASTKTSPLSWYTYVGFGWWGHGEQPWDVGEPVAVARVNRALLDRISRAVLTDPARRDHLGHHIAPGLRIRGERVLFRRDVPVPVTGRMFATREEQVEMRASGPLRFLVGLVRAASPDCPTPAELVVALADRLGGAEAIPAATGYVHQLIDSGVLVAADPVSPQHPERAEPLAAWLAEQGLPNLAAAVLRLDERTAAFSSLPAGKRPAALAELADGWAQAGDAAGDATHPVQVDLTGIPPLSEDVVLPGRFPLGGRHGQGSLPTLARLTPFLMLFDQQLLIRLMVRDAFVERYGRGAIVEPVALAELLDEVVPKAFTIGRGPSSGRAEELGTAVCDLLDLRTGLAALIDADSAPGAADRAIPERAARMATALLPDWAKRRTASYSLFVQPTRAGLVVNHVYAGFGRFTSRFLDYLAPSARYAVASQLRLLLGEQTAQFRPVGGFNANLHPVVTGLEIGEEPTWADLTADLVEAYHDERTDQIRLRNTSTGQTINVLYLGFLIPFMLPSRMAAFNSDLDCGLLDLSPLTRSEAVAGVTRTGRLTFGDVVLSRRSWRFTDHAVTELLGTIGNARSQALAVAELRARHGIPQHVFVGAAGVVRSFEDFGRQLAGPKAQYVDLSNALHLRHLAKVIGRFGGGVRFTEALPVPGDNPDRRVVELIVETYRRGQ
jgi:hypothetical protein